MLKHSETKTPMMPAKNTIVSMFALLFFLSQLIHYVLLRPLGYSFFIELTNACGIQVGTSIRMRGIPIGYIKSVRLKLNCVLAVAKINSCKTLIPVSSIIETAQTGLLNDSVIDIIPCDNLFLYDAQNHSPLSKYCNSSVLICNRMYIAVDRGLNYDDLVRSATRISQRFDDPRFFNIFYIFLRSSIEATELFAEFLTILTSVCS